MDQSLDEIIQQNRGSQRGRGRGGFRGGRGNSGGGGVSGGFQRRSGGQFGNKTRAMGSFSRGSGRTPQGQWQHDRFNNAGNGGGRILRSTDGAGANATTKLLITNLEFGVSDADVKELFSEFGPLKRASVHYDKSGRSLGTADVIFERKVDAIKALKQYNNVPLDGRPMKIQLVGANSATAITSAGGGSVTSRLGIGARRGGIRGRQSSSGGGRGGTGVNRGGRGGGGGGGRGGRQKKEAVTQQQLDAELDAYVNKMESNE